MIIQSELTALPSSIPNAPLRRFLEWKEKTYNYVLDLGCGRMRDSDLYAEHFSYTTFYDPYFRPETKNLLYTMFYNLVICTYVLNVLTIKERRRAMRILRYHLSIGADILLAVRHISRRSDINPDWLRYEDGYITRKMTFQKFFSDAEIYDLFKDYCIVELNKGVYVISVDK